MWHRTQTQAQALPSASASASAMNNNWLPLTMSYDYPNGLNQSLEEGPYCESLHPFTFTLCLHSMLSSILARTLLFSPYLARRIQQRPSGSGRTIYNVYLRRCQGTDVSVIDTVSRRHPILGHIGHIGHIGSHPDHVMPRESHDNATPAWDCLKWRRRRSSGRLLHSSCTPDPCRIVSEHLRKACD